MAGGATSVIKWYDHSEVGQSRKILPHFLACSACALASPNLVNWTLYCPRAMSFSSPR